MTNSSTSPLLQPPPQDLSDTVMLRQWMVNIYTYLYQQSVVNTASGTATNTSISEISDTVSENELAAAASITSSLVTASGGDTWTLALKNSEGTTLSSANILENYAATLTASHTGSIAGDDYFITINLKNSNGTVISTTTQQVNYF